MGLMSAIGLQPRQPAPSVTSQGTQTPVVRLQNAETQTERELPSTSAFQTIQARQHCKRRAHTHYSIISYFIQRVYICYRNVGIFKQSSSYDIGTHAVSFIVLCLTRFHKEINNEANSSDKT